MADVLAHHFAIFLRNHGVVACGTSIEHALIMATALEAAHSIHSDLARGFIRAEIMAVDDLLPVAAGLSLVAY